MMHQRQDITQFTLPRQHAIGDDAGQPSLVNSPLQLVANLQRPLLFPDEQTGPFPSEGQGRPSTCVDNIQQNA